ncbi:MAG: MATE family efflux transporter, partial [Clostridia bacterium]|nr:MATE family efflux transporter [Clostridia bacterium]
MLKLRNIDATKGKLLPSIVLYALPLILSTLIQTLFHAVDLIVLRYAADGIAVASVGATGTITSLIINAFIGLSGGTNVILARFIGAKDHDNTRKTVSTSLITSLGIGLFSAVLGFFLAEPMLNLTKCPADCFDGALLYLRIYFLASPFILVYNFAASILRTSGDTNRPLLYMLLSGILNVVLNVVLCMCLDEKVAAVAIATFASQVLGAVCAVARLCKNDGDCKIVLRHLKWDLHIFGRILRLGLPICLHGALFPLANLQIQSAINSFGSAAIAGNTAAANLETITSSTTSAFGTAALTFAGQNLGAGNKDRVKKSIAICFTIAVCCGLFFGLLFYSFGEFFLSFFVGNDPVAIGYGMIRCGFLLAFYFVAAMNQTLGSVLQAFGYTSFVSLNSIGAVFGMRIL